MFELASFEPNSFKPALFELVFELRFGPNFELASFELASFDDSSFRVASCDIASFNPGSFEVGRLVRDHLCRMVCNLQRVSAFVREA